VYKIPPALFRTVAAATRERRAKADASLTIASYISRAASCVAARVRLERVLDPGNERVLGGFGAHHRGARDQRDHQIRGRRDARRPSERDAHRLARRVMTGASSHTKKSVFLAPTNA
jgi:hypothetical protein